MLEINKIHHGDCLELMKEIEDKSIDLVLIDPPYKLVSGGQHRIKLKGVSQDKLNKGTLFEHNDITFEEWLPEIYRILKDDTHCYIMVNDRNLNDLLNACKKVGLKLLNILVWKKNVHSPTQYYMKNCEFIVFLRKGRAKYINNIGTKSILEFEVVKDRIHPTEKSISLLQCLIENSTKEKDLVLDCFSCSGSLAVAAYNTRRNFICIEKDKDYYEKSVERLNIAQAQLRLF